MSASLKKDVIGGIVWSSIQRFGAVGIAFIANLFFSRLLTPEDFGCIGMLSIFIAISNIFIDGGFGSALIQRKDPTHLDYSTVFYWNIALSLILYAILYIISPLIASFYNTEILSGLLRILGITLIINAFAAVQANILRKNLQFKKLAIAYITSTFISSSIGVILAYNDFGVYSLAIYNVINSILTLILISIFCKFIPGLYFSFQSIKNLFNFGGVMMLSNLVEIIYVNIQSVIIGKKYSASDLGYYTQANKLAEIPGNTLSSIVNAVTFPAFSKINSEKDRLKHALNVNVILASYFTFPLFAILIIIAEPLILFLYGEQWEQSIDLFQIICLQAMFFTINTANTNMILSLGKSKFYFKIQLLKRSIAIICIIVGLFFGLKGMLVGLVVSSYIFFVINAIASSKVIGYKFSEQLKDVSTNYILSFVIAILVNLANPLLSNLQALFVMPVLFIALYIIISLLLNIKGYSIVKELLFKKTKNI